MAIGIETDRGLWVQALSAAGYQVYAVTPLAVTRYRERHQVRRWDVYRLLNPKFATNSVMGKRYVDANGGEVLVTKPGAGPLTVGCTPLAHKEAKPLPASD